MNRKPHLPVYGVGPLYVGVILLLTAAGIWLSNAGCLPVVGAGRFRVPVAAVGALLILFGLCLWWRAVFRARVDVHIKSNTLVTTGVYAWVRNPIYAAFLLACTGAVLLADNLYLLVLPVVDWAYLTLLMKGTEEKWLTALYGQAYRDYCRRVNRCIPWFPKK